MPSAELSSVTPPPHPLTFIPPNCPPGETLPFLHSLPHPLPSAAPATPGHLWFAGVHKQPAEQVEMQEGSGAEGQPGSQGEARRQESNAGQLPTSDQPQQQHQSLTGNSHTLWCTSHCACFLFVNPKPGLLVLPAWEQCLCPRCAPCVLKMHLHLLTGVGSSDSADHDPVWNARCTERKAYSVPVQVRITRTCTHDKTLHVLHKVAIAYCLCSCRYAAKDPIWQCGPAPAAAGCLI